MPDPYLEMGGGGGGRWRRAQSPKKFFSDLRASVWSKNKEGGRPPPQAPRLDPPLEIHIRGD